MGYFPAFFGELSMVKAVAKYLFFHAWKFKNHMKGTSRREEVYIIYNIYINIFFK